MEAAPRFVPIERGDAPARIERVEHYLGRHDEWSRGAHATLVREGMQRDGRISAVETAVQAIREAVVSLKVRVGMALACGGALVGFLVAWLLK